MGCRARKICANGMWSNWDVAQLQVRKERNNAPVYGAPYGVQAHEAAAREGTLLTGGTGEKSGVLWGNQRSASLRLAQKPSSTARHSQTPAAHNYACGITLLAVSLNT